MNRVRSALGWETGGQEAGAVTNAPENDNAGALGDVRVIDLSTSMAGAWCTRLLADFGADVVMVEPPGGSPLRRLAPSDGNGDSIPARYVHANKRSIILDLGQPNGRRALSRILRNSDIVVESGHPGSLDGYGVGLDELEQRWPKLILASITPHGQDGGREQRPGNDLTAYAQSGWASINGLAHREPLKGSGFSASYVAGIAAYGAVVTALNVRDGDGHGQRVDVAEVEALAAAFAPVALRGQYQATVPPRKATMDLTTGPVPVKDGHFALTISRAHFWRDAMNLLGLPDLAEDRRFDAGLYRQQHKEQYVERTQEQMAQWDKMALFDALATLRVVAGPVLTMDELASNEHLSARGYFSTPADDPQAPQYPGAPFKLSAAPWALRRRAPRPGEHSVRVLREVAGYTDDWVGAMAESGALG